MLRPKQWNNSYEYKRILEILDEYWISQADEAEVEITMHFLHRNGETQDKRIIWRNPNINSMERNYRR